jgi:serine protease Do
MSGLRFTIVLLSIPILMAEVSLSQSLQTMSATAEAFRYASARVEPLLVTIESYGGVGTKVGEIGGIRKQGEGNTTGVLISDDGYVITSTFNFLTRPLIITVVTSDGVRRVARMKGQDDSRKICVLKIEDTSNLPATTRLEFADVESIDVGQWAISMGVGYGDRNPAVSMGIISAKNRIGGRAIQTDANISPANYGGPLIDIEGRLIGICVPMNPQSSAIEAGVEWYDSGIGFAIPLSNSQSLIDRLKEPGIKIQSAFLGIQSTADSQGKGLFIESVAPGSAAEAAGVGPQDIVLELDGKPVPDILVLKRILNRFEAGDQTTIKFIRTARDSDDQDQERTVKLTFLPPPKPKEDIDRLQPPKIR